MKYNIMVNGQQYDARLDWRAHLAWSLLSQWSLVAGVTCREDSSGRAVCDVMPATDVVARAFDIVDEFIRIGERDGNITLQTEEMESESHRRIGELERIQNKAMYPRRLEDAVTED